MTYLFGEEQWKSRYRAMNNAQRERVWMIVHTSNGEEIYLEEYKDWMTIQEYCDTTSCTIDAVGLSWHGHVVTTDTKGYDGVYVAMTAKGAMGSGVTKHCWSIGKVQGDKLIKTLWSAPELVQDITIDCEVKDCIPQALVIYDKDKRPS